MTRLSAIAFLAAIVFSVSAASAQSPLGAAQSFAVLGASTVTNTGATVITGDVGVSPGTALTGFLQPPLNVIVGPGTVTPGEGLVYGTIHAGDAIAAAAHSDAFSAYAGLVALDCDVNLSGQDLGTLAAPLTPGVYCFDSSAQLTGILTLDAQNDPNALFVFQIGSTLTTASYSSVEVINGGQGCMGSDVFWQVGTSATLGTYTEFAGHILALISITVTTGVNVSGSVIALTGAVTMDTNTISVCGAGSGTTFPPHGAIKVTGGGQIPVPDPDNDAADATGTGRATFGFNAQPDKSGGAKGHFNYLNHVTGLHVNGPVTDIVVIAVYTDGTPKTVLFLGLCNGVPSCSFSVIVEDHGEPGTIDQFGITIVGDVSEVRSQRVISRGNIQFHKDKK
jgi:hypothetical protein